MIVSLICAVIAAACLFYTFCYAPPAQRVADEIFYDPLLDSMLSHPYILEEDGD